MNESNDVIFFSNNKRYKLGADAIQREVRDGGVVVTPAHVIEFHEHIYRTSDKKEIEIIKKSQEFKNKQVRIIDQNEFNKYLKVQAMKISGSVARDSEEEETGVPN